MRVVRQDMPLDRLADAAWPESGVARTFNRDVNLLLREPAPTGLDTAVRAMLTTWNGNHERLDPVLAASPRAREARSLSRDLSALAALGLEAHDAVRAKRPPSAEWYESATRLLDQAAKPRAEVALMIVPGLRKLALAAVRIEETRTLSLPEWNRKLDEQLKAAAHPPDEH